MSLLIKNGRLVNPGNPAAEGELDVWIEGDKVKRIGKHIADKAAKVVDAAGKYVFPGLIDLHVHLREPGYEYKEDIASGTRAAARGGFTTINCMPNTSPALDSPKMIEFVTTQAKEKGVVRVLPTACITKGRAGKELVDMAGLYEAQVRTLSDDGDTVDDARLMQQAFALAGKHRLTIISHAEEASLSRGGVMHEGFVATQLGLKGIPSAAEEIIVLRDILLADIAGAFLHFAHISTTGSVELIRAAQREGVKVTAEVTPHHFTLSDEAVRDFGSSAKVNPPLRGLADILACVKGVREGVISVIASDHAPHADFEKERDFVDAPFGISGLETALSLSFGVLHRKHKIPLGTVIAALTVNPAKILDRGDLGVLRENFPADITLFDPEARWRVDPSCFASKGKNTPFSGREMSGRVTHTIYGGELVFQGGNS